MYIFFRCFYVIAGVGCVLFFHGVCFMLSSAGSECAYHVSDVRDISICT